MPTTDLPLKHAVIDAYREQLRYRYSLENVRRFVELETISDSTVDVLRDYFLECVYPSSAERDRLDVAFDHMSEIVRSPRRLAPLMKVAFTTAWKLGVKFPQALAAGKHTVETYLETRKLEASMLDYAMRERLTPADFGEHHVVMHMLASVPEHEVVRFRNEALKLFESFSNAKLLAAIVEIMDKSRKLMESRRDVYDERELAGIDLGLEVLRRGLGLVQKLKPSEFSAIRKGIEVVEIDWYDRIKVEAAP
jgi:hypothetical protein